MNDPGIRSVREAESDRLAAILTLALCSDPSTRWATPDANQYMSVMMPLVPAFAGRLALQKGSAHVIGDFLGAALWLPPGTAPDEDAAGEIFAAHVAEPHLSEIGALFEAMARHHPKVPHWYLWIIGVDPAHQRKGLGAALLSHGVRACDRDGTPAYLEATSPLSVPLYQQFGFEVLEEISVCGSPPLFPMIRQPR